MRCLRRCDLLCRGSTSPAASPLVVATEGSVVAGSVTATDRAGNSATFASSAFKINKTQLTVSVTSPATGATYLLNAAISATYTCADGLSGLATGVGSQANGPTLARWKRSHPVDNFAGRG